MEIDDEEEHSSSNIIIYFIDSKSRAIKAIGMKDKEKEGEDNSIMDTAEIKALKTRLQCIPTPSQIITEAAV